MPSLPAVANVLPSGANATEVTCPLRPVRACPRRALARSVTSHTRVVPTLPTFLLLLSLPPTASVRPSGAKATAAALPLCSPANGGPSARALAGSVRSQRSTVPSPSPTASVRPSGAKAMEATLPCPGGSDPSARGLAGSVTSQRRVVPSLSPVASVRRSGANATDDTVPRWPVREPL